MEDGSCGPGGYFNTDSQLDPSAKMPHHKCFKLSKTTRTLCEAHVVTVPMIIFAAYSQNIGIFNKVEFPIW